MKRVTIGFIGGGNMAASLIGGLVQNQFDPAKIVVAEPNDANRQQLEERYGVVTTVDNLEVASQADVIVLAVKPQVMHEVCAQIGGSATARRPLLISIAAGIRCEAILRWLGGTDLALVRTMPNTPSLVRSGATGLFATASVTTPQRELAEALLRAVGLTLWVDREELLDVVTAVSGSGPAYFFLMMEVIETIGAKLGLEPESARLLSLQTAFGAAKMALESDDDPATLRRKVTSPGGTTERAIGILEEGSIRDLFERALSGARDRAAELADQLGKL